MDVEQSKISDLLKKIDQMKKSGEVDLSTEEDLSIAIMNLISLEEHFFFTNAKTGKEEYLDLLLEVREIRKTLLARLVSKHEGETWCISKHLLGTTMRLMEVGTKLLSDGKKDEAKEVYAKANEIYSLFWALRLKLIDISGLKKVAASEQPWTLNDIMNKLVDCCDE
ncbi:MAG: hypothetical protein Q7S78_00800 [Candidatus Azambacteria bacterium]|nr:hypothetical protein [Candidatus Azambacteria bacterium]